MVLVRMVPVLVHARKRTFFMTETTISNTICWLFEKVRFCKSFCLAPLTDPPPHTVPQVQVQNMLDCL